MGRFTGIGTAFAHQQEALRRAHVSFTTDPRGEYDVLHTNWFHPQTVYYVLRAKRRGIKVVLHAHATPEEFKTARLGALTYGPMRRYLVWFYNLADLVLVPSAHTKTVLSSYGIRPPIRAISNGVDDVFFKPDAKRRARYRKRFSLEGAVVFNVGQVVARKGIGDFLNVARSLPELQFIWFGKRYDRFWEPSIASRAPRNVKLTGFVDDAVAAFHSGDIFFFPSLEENQGIVLLEAAALGKPLVVRDIPTFEGWLVDGVNCLKGKTPDEFSAHLRKLSVDEALRLHLGKEARAMAQGHRLEVIGERLRQAYESVITAGSTGQ